MCCLFLDEYFAIAVLQQLLYYCCVTTVTLLLLLQQLLCYCCVATVTLLTYVVVFDFLGKDSIPYYNEVSVEKHVFNNLQLFMQDKSPDHDLFDKLKPTLLNKHLNDLMDVL